MKRFNEISWQVSEEEYRADPALSYSTLATYEREGFNGLCMLYEKKESESLLFGSCVDSILTGGFDEFNERFIVKDIPQTEPSVEKVIKVLFELFGNKTDNLNKVSDANILDAINQCDYQRRWRDDNRIKSIREKGSDYFNALSTSQDKTIVSEDMYEEVLLTVNKLKTSEATRWIFNQPIEQNKNIEIFYQLKFKTTLDGIDFRCMADIIIVDYDNKIILPIDLKTSSHYEWDFWKSFIDWNYAIQARLYWRIIKNVMDKDDFFKDFTLDDYRFVVANKKTLTPLVWLFSDTQKVGELSYHNGAIKFRDPFIIAKELLYYLNTDATVPIGIQEIADNDLVWMFEHGS